MSGRSRGGRLINKRPREEGGEERDGAAKKARFQEIDSPGTEKEQEKELSATEAVPEKELSAIEVEQEKVSKLIIDLLE